MHMPGHKGKTETFEDLRILSQSLFELDVTEIEDLDDLHKPSSFFKQAQDALSQVHHSKKSYLLVNGSTSGITAAILGTLSAGDTILIDPNAHQAVYRAIQWGRLFFQKIKASILDGFDFFLPPTPQDVKEALLSFPNSKAVFITNPNYYGVSTDIEEIARICHAKGIMLIVDEAHGAHWDYANTGYPKSAMKSGADISIQSYHKTLPALTQTAVMHLGTLIDKDMIRDIEEVLHFVISSSPSFILAASIDIARTYMQNSGALLLEKLQQRTKILHQNLSNHTGYTVLGLSNIPPGYELDPSRLTLNIKFNAKAFLKYIHDNNIFPEFLCGQNILFIITVSDTDQDIETLMEIIQSVKLSKDKKGVQASYPLEVFLNSQQEISLFEASKRPKDFRPLTESVGSICGEQITPYPPGIPLLVPGERVTAEKIKCLESLISNNQTIYAHNLSQGIKVLREL